MFFKKKPTKSLMIVSGDLGLIGFLCDSINQEVPNTYNFTICDTVTDGVTQYRERKNKDNPYNAIFFDELTPNNEGLVFAPSIRAYDMETLLFLLSEDENLKDLGSLAFEVGYNGVSIKEMI